MPGLASLLLLLGALGAGMGLGALRLIPRTRVVQYLLNASLYALLFFMGLRIGRNPAVEAQLARIGIISISFAAATVGGTILAVAAAYSLARRFRGASAWAAAGSAEGARDPAVGASAEDGGPVARAFGGLREPLLLLLLVVSGFCVGFFARIFPGFSGERMTTWLLYALILFVGFNLARSRVQVRLVLLQPATIVVPLATILGSLGGGLALGAALGIPAGKALALASGFGWYSLSGVLITNMGDPLLGSAGFLANLFREGLALLTIPLLGRSRIPALAIGAGGATSMDVTLPLIARSCGAAYVPLAVVNGALLSFLVPVLVPLFFQL